MYTIDKLTIIIRRLLAARDNCEHYTRAERIARLDARQALAEMRRTIQFNCNTCNDIRHIQNAIGYLIPCPDCTAYPTKDHYGDEHV